MSDLGPSPLPTLVLLAALALVPIFFMTATSFMKISFVFSILRNALGTGQAPSGAVISALAMVLTLYVMSPVASQMQSAFSPYQTQIDWDHAFDGASAGALWDGVAAAKEPLREFLARNAGKRETRLFLDLAKRARPEHERADLTEHDWLVVFPSFLITELGEAFQIGFLVFLPFLVIDIVISNILLALGMQMLSPTTVSLPFKLLLFVMVDGWYLLARALILGYV